MTEKSTMTQTKSAFLKFIDKYGLAVLFLVFFLYSVFYVASRSFWIDESMVALSIVKSGISPFVPLEVA